MKKTGLPTQLCSSLVFLLIAICTILDQTGALLCWQNSCSSTEDANHWHIQDCNTTDNETSCLAQYRSHNGIWIPSYFGCHATDTPCNQSCEVNEGQCNDYSCCCSGDLCNSLSEITPSGGINGLCQQIQCNHSCVEHEGKPHCYCDWGYVLDKDKRTCVDVNECEYNNGGCEGTCHNEIGTGFHCGCSDDQILKDGFRCENFSGLVCYSQRSNGVGNSQMEREFCDMNTATDAHCQATYKQDKKTGTFSVRLLSCFSGRFPCDQGGCELREIGSSTIYHCCCDGHLCNGNITFPK